ncbi:hypothetical protein ACFV1L_10355 [Kitasatospora sp. NPDC059646]|uniref:hypothetical protein n=1 Tax=Kitasatospora sp. NPDC059646 TaxID=3346893 RepID=UPI00367C3DAB
MYLFSKAHTLNEHMATSGRSAITVGATHTRPISDTVVVRVFHPTTGGGRSFVLTRDEVTDLNGSLQKWLAEGWAGFVEGAPRPGEGTRYPVGTVGDGGDIWDALERRRQEWAEQDRKNEEAFANTYASWSHDELVAEIKLQKFNREAAESREAGWRSELDAERTRMRALFGRLRAALDGKRTASVEDLNAALREEA